MIDNTCLPPRGQPGVGSPCAPGDPPKPDWCGPFTTHGVPLSVWMHPVMTRSLRRSLAAVWSLVAGTCRSFKKDRCFVANAKLAAVLGLSVGHFRRLLRLLVRAGLILKVKTDANKTGRELVVPHLSPDPGAESPKSLGERQRSALGERQRPGGVRAGDRGPGAPARTESLGHGGREIEGGGGLATQGPPPPPDGGEEDRPLAPGEFAAMLAARHHKPAAAPPGPAKASTAPPEPAKASPDLDAVRRKQEAALAELAAHKAKREATEAAKAAPTPEPAPALTPTAPASAFVPVSAGKPPVNEGRKTGGGPRRGWPGVLKLDQVLGHLPWRPGSRPG